jgi:hypothetical protein
VVWIVEGVRPAAGIIVVFIAAAAVLMLEILAARMLAPYVGVSLITYTGIIGTVLHIHSSSLQAIIVFSGLTFFLPAFLLSGVTPVVVKLQLHSLTTTGRTVGRLSGAGTFGALVGTFGTGFFLTSRVHTHAITIGVGVALICLGAAALWWVSPRRSVPALAVLGAATVAGSVPSAQVRSPCRIESAYFCIGDARVLTDDFAPVDQLLQ